MKPRKLHSDFPFLQIEEYTNIYEGQDIGTCGFPLGNYLQEQLGTMASSFTKGIISSFIPGPYIEQRLLKGFQLNLTATRGNSGGPVFSLATGKVLGVLQRAVQEPNGNFLPNMTKAEPVYPAVNSKLVTELKEQTKITQEKIGPEQS